MRSAPSAFYALAFFALFFTSCFTPQKIIQMESGENQKTKWNYGREVVHVKKGDYEARIYFEDFTKKDLIFDVEVVNLGDEEILLKPENIHLIPDVGARSWSYDPEKEIFGEQMEMSRREAGSKNAAVAIAVAAVATVAVAAATSDGNDDGDDDFEAFDDNGNTFVYVNNAVPPPALQYLPPNIGFWKDYALRKTTLEKGYKVGGKVVFPRMDDAREFVMIVPIGEEKIKARFRQKLFQP